MYLCNFSLLRLIVLFRIRLDQLEAIEKKVEMLELNLDDHFINMYF